MSKMYYTTVSHVSPMLTYIPGGLWTEPSPTSDANLSQYWAQSYHSTDATLGNARVMFSFFGTGVSVYGGYRRRLGPYTVVLDGNNANQTTFPGFQVGDQENFDQVLYNVSGLEPRYHQLEIINSGNDSTRPVLDINRIVYERAIPTDPRNISCQEDSMRWSSGRASSWIASNSSVDTTSSMAHMGYNFYVPAQGTGISVYGTIHPMSAPFFVAIDGWRSQLLYPNAQVAPATKEPQLLFTRSALLADNHTLTIRNNPVYSAGGPNALSISHMVVFNSVGEPQSQFKGVDKDGPDRPDGPSAGAEAAEVVVFVLLFMILVAVACLGYRRMRNSRRDLRERIRPFVLTPRPPMQERAEPYDAPYEDPYDPSYQYVLVHNDKRSSLWTARTSPTLFVTDESRTQATMGRQRTLPKLPRLHVLHSPPSSWHSRNRSSVALAQTSLMLLPRTGEEARPRGDQNV